MRAAELGRAVVVRGDLEWTYYEVPLVEDLRELREIIFRKYQRRRVSAEDLAAVEKMLREHERAQKLPE